MTKAREAHNNAYALLNGDSRLAEIAVGARVLVQTAVGQLHGLVESQLPAARVFQGARRSFARARVTIRLTDPDGQPYPNRPANTVTVDVSCVAPIMRPGG